MYSSLKNQVQILDVGRLPFGSISIVLSHRLSCQAYSPQFGFSIFSLYNIKGVFVHRGKTTFHKPILIRSVPTENTCEKIASAVGVF